MKWITLFFVITTHLLLSQTHYKGFSAGLNYSRVERQGYDYYKNLIGFGVEGNYEFKKRLLLLKSSIGYQQKGLSQELVFVDTSGNILGEGALEWTAFNYLSLSQHLGIQVGNKVFGICSIGLGTGCYLFTKVHSEDFKLDNGQISKGYTYRFSNLQRFDLWFSGEIGFGYKTKTVNEIFFLGGYNHGLTKIKYSNYPTPQPWLNHNWFFRIGTRSELNFKRKGVKKKIDDNAPK